MRWNCPHCGTHLAMADEKMGSGWSFSRCYHCAGFALVKSSEQNIIKVDRAPAGEKVILPEASETPMLSELAMRNLASYRSSPRPSLAASAGFGDSTLGAPMSFDRNDSPTKSIVKPAARKPSMPLSRPAFGADGKIANAASEIAKEVAPPLVQPLAPVSTQISNKPLAGPNAPAGATADLTAMAYLNGVNGVSKVQGFPDALPEVPDREGKISFLPMAIGIAAAFAFGSGLYIVFQSGTFFDSPQTSMHHKSRSEMNHGSASLAPEDEPAANTSASPAVQNTVAQAAPQAVAPQQQMQPNRSGEQKLAQAEPPRPYTDQLRSRAMAPSRQEQDLGHTLMKSPTAPHPVQLSSENPPLVVQPKAKNIHLRSGPGMVYPVVGSANESVRYVVTDWSDRWFKVLPQVREDGANTGEDEPMGWIRTDAVQIISATN